jgi:ABC-type nitrate/sulfonate/bicarbonate transport system permease component
MRPLLIRWVGTGRRAGLRLLPAVAVVLAWQLAVAAGWVRPLFLPSPAMVWNEFLGLLRGQELVAPALLSVYRALAGLLLAVAVGVLIGLGMARSGRLRWMLDPLVSVGFPAPKIAFMPIFVLWFGIDDVSKILLVAFTCVFPMIVATVQGALSVPRAQIWSAEAMGSSSREVLRRVVLPATAPYIFSGIRIAVPVALITAYTAEMIGGGGGLGGTLMYAQRFFETPTVFVCILLMLMTGMLLDRLMLSLRRLVIPWQDEDHG